MIIPPSQQDAAVDRSGAPENRFIGWCRVVTDKINLLAPEEGSGSPEGVVEARKHKQYIDTDYPPGATLYIKTIDGGNTGWQVIG